MQQTNTNIKAKTTFYDEYEKNGCLSIQMRKTLQKNDEGPI